MRKICVTNHKGGVGKTTTAINLAAGLAALGFRCLAVDCDPQGHTTLGLGVSVSDKYTLSELLLDDTVGVLDVVQNTYIPNLDIIPSDLSLAGTELQLAQMPAKEFRLRNKLQKVTQYDFVIFDCPPTFGTLPMNVFCYCDEIVLPVQLGYFSLEGVNTFIETIDFINKNVGPIVNHNIRLAGILITFCDIRTKIAKQIYEEIHTIFGEKVYKSTIPQNVKLNESQSVGKAIFDYDPECKGAVAYMNLAREVTKKGVV